MLYKLAHILKDKFCWLWSLIENVNGWLFTIRYGKKLELFDITMVPDGYKLTPLKDVPTNELVAFFERQPKDAFKYFNPHGFEKNDIRRLQQNKSFLGYVLFDKENNQIAGYCFNRCFFHGQGFRGRMVDIDYRGKGISTAMNRILNEVGFGIGLRLFETVSKDNVASYRSALSASKTKIVKELKNNELFLEILNG